jgi:transposase InsO family protein
MSEMGIAGASGRKRIRTTDSNHDNPVAENLLDRNFTATGPNQRWVTDITGIETDEGNLYLSAIEDLFSRKVVGWAMDAHMETSLIVRALDMAIGNRKPDAGLLHHSDRGCQYTSGGYRQLLADHGMTASMSRRGNCYDNACAESFWGRLKVELIYRQHYRTRAEARAAVFEFIEVFYNRTRRHSSLGYLSPDAFEAAYLRNQAA